MKLLNLPQFKTLNEKYKVKVVRHRDASEDLWDLYRNGSFQTYQNGQSWDVFGGAECIISFIAARHKYATYVGVWKILRSKQRKDGGLLYSTQKLPEFDELAERLIVKWGEGTRSWAQWLDRKGNKEIHEILPTGYVKEFPGYYDFTLTYAELAQIINNPDSNREWQRMLSSHSGVYLILDKKSGRQYIGSAYGRGGIWARWRTYVKNPSGGNKQLKQLLSQDRNRYENFQYSILRVLEPGSTKDEVIKHESLLKKKLGSRAFGLNSN